MKKKKEKSRSINIQIMNQAEPTTQTQPDRITGGKQPDRTRINKTPNNIK